MRSILISLLLIIVVIVLYQAVAEGDGGLKQQMNRSGSAMSDHIRSMSP